VETVLQGVDMAALTRRFIPYLLMAVFLILLIVAVIGIAQGMGL
jgi:hypothetical protein